MGQKVKPHGLRVGVIKDWDSKWYADSKSFADNLIEDNTVRKYVKNKLYAAGVSKILIERPANNKLNLTILADKPGMIIGRSGDGIDKLKADLEKMVSKTVLLSIIEVRRSELDAQLTAESIAQALEKRISFRRAMKQAIGRTMKAGAGGIKVMVSGRLGGAEIARSEKYSEGNVPLHTIRANIDYGFAEADTTYGKLGVKVWINHGEILDKDLKSPIPESGDDKRDHGDRRDRRDRRDKRSRDDRGDRRDGKRRDSRSAKPELPKAANARKRSMPKREEISRAETEQPQVEIPQTESVETPQNNVEE